MLENNFLREELVEKANCGNVVKFNEEEIVSMMIHDLIELALDKREGKQFRDILTNNEHEVVDKLMKCIRKFVAYACWEDDVILSMGNVMYKLISYEYDENDIPKNENVEPVKADFFTNIAFAIYEYVNECIGCEELQKKLGMSEGQMAQAFLSNCLKDIDIDFMNKLYSNNIQYMAQMIMSCRKND